MTTGVVLCWGVAGMSCPPGLASAQVLSGLQLLIVAARKPVWRDQCDLTVALEQSMAVSGK